MTQTIYQMMDALKHAREKMKHFIAINQLDNTDLFVVIVLKTADFVQVHLTQNAQNASLIFQKGFQMMIYAMIFNVEMALKITMKPVMMEILHQMMAALVLANLKQIDFTVIKLFHRINQDVENVLNIA